MKVQVLGTGCPKCRTLERNAREAVAMSGMEAEVVKISDIDRIMEMGVMMTPALAIDGSVKKAGKILSADKILRIMKGE